jgi:hypothetical protein
MKNKYQWYKYREHTAGGVGEWKYIYIPYVSYMPQQDWIEEYLDRKGLLCTWSEHFRRVEIKKVSMVPEKIVEDEICKTEYCCKEYKEKLDWLRYFRRQSLIKV